MTINLHINQTKDAVAVSMITNALFIWNPALAVKFAIQAGLYIRTIINLGTPKHDDFIRDAVSLQDTGCFALTELGHGSNVRDLLTTAEYNA